MKKISFFLIILTARILYAQETEPTTMARNQIRAFLEETETLYGSEDSQELAEAATRFRALLEQAPEGELNPDALKLAEGMAKLKAEKFEEALGILDEIEGFDLPEFRGQLRQMKGNAQLKLAEAAVANEDWENAKSGMGKAITSFTNALRENPEMDAARNNLEFAQKRLREIKEMEPPPPEDQQKQEDQEENQDDKKQPSEEQEKQEEQNQEQQNQDEQNQEQGQQQEPQEQDQNQDQQDQGDESEEENPAEESQADENQQADQQQSEDQAGAAGEMSDAEKLDALQAQQILDAALEQEKAQRRLIQQQRVRVIPVEKDW